jgi:hypothetical protein
MVNDILYIKQVLLDAFQSYVQLAKQHLSILYYEYRVFFNLINQPTKALKKLKFIRSIKLLHVLAPGYHPQGVFEQGNIGPTH